MTNLTPSPKYTRDYLLGLISAEEKARRERAAIRLRERLSSVPFYIRAARGEIPGGRRRGGGNGLLAADARERGAEQLGVLPEALENIFYHRTEKFWLYVKYRG